MPDRVFLGSPHLFDFATFLDSTRKTFELLASVGQQKYIHISAPELALSIAFQTTEFRRAMTLGVGVAELGYAAVKDIISLAGIMDSISVEDQAVYLKVTYQIVKKAHDQAKKMHEAFEDVRRNLSQAIHEFTEGVEGSGPRHIVSTSNLSSTVDNAETQARKNVNDDLLRVLTAQKSFGEETYALSQWLDWSEIEKSLLETEARADAPFDGLASLRQGSTVEQWESLRKTFLDYVATVAKLEDSYPIPLVEPRVTSKSTHVLWRIRKQLGTSIEDNTHHNHKPAQKPRDAKHVSSGIPRLVPSADAGKNFSTPFPCGALACANADTESSTSTNSSSSLMNTEQNSTYARETTLPESPQRVRPSPKGRENVPTHLVAFEMPTAEKYFVDVEPSSCGELRHSKGYRAERVVMDSFTTGIQDKHDGLDPVMHYGPTHRKQPGAMCGTILLPLPKCEDYSNLKPERSLLTRSNTESSCSDGYVIISHDLPSKSFLSAELTSVQVVEPGKCLMIVSFQCHPSLSRRFSDIEIRWKFKPHRTLKIIDFAPKHSTGAKNTEGRSKEINIGIPPQFNVGGLTAGVELGAKWQQEKNLMHAVSITGSVRGHRRDEAVWTIKENSSIMSGIPAHFCVAVIAQYTDIVLMEMVLLFTEQSSWKGVRKETRGELHVNVEKDQHSFQEYRPSRYWKEWFPLISGDVSGAATTHMQEALSQG